MILEPSGDLTKSLQTKLPSIFNYKMFTNDSKDLLSGLSKV